MDKCQELIGSALLFPRHCLNLIIYSKNVVVNVFVFRIEMPKRRLRTSVPSPISIKVNFFNLFL